MSDSPRPRTVLVTGSATRLGREIALALAAGGWQVAVHYRGSAARSGADRGRLRAGSRRRARESTASRPTWPTKPQAAALLPRVIERFGAVDAVVNNASLFEHDTRRELRLRGAAGPRCAPTPARRSCWPRRCTQHACTRGADARRRRRGEHAGPEAVEPEPRFPQLHAVQGRAGSAPPPCWRMALAPQLRVVGVAPGPDPDQPSAVAGEVRAAAQAVAAGPLVDRRRTWRVP